MQQQTSAPAMAREVKPMTRRLTRAGETRFSRAPSARRAEEDRERRHRERAIATYLRSLVR